RRAQEGPRRAALVRPPGGRGGERGAPPPPPGGRGGGARRARGEGRRGRRRVAARLPEPPLRSPLRPLPLDRASSGREGIPLGATAQARSRRARAPRSRGATERPMKQPIYFKQLEVGPTQNYVYLLGDPTTHEAAVVDAAWDVDALVRTADADGYRITTDLVTHFHPDHLGGDLMGHQIRGAAELLAKVPAKVVV